MKKASAISILSVIVLVGIVAPSVTYAQQREVPLGETTYEQAYVPCGLKDEGKDGVVDDPCKFTDIIILAKKLIMGLIIGGVIIATMGFAYAGLLYITSMGSTEKISHAHSIFIKTFWGFVFMLSAWLIAYTMERIFLNEEALKRSFLAEPPASP